MSYHRTLCGGKARARRHVPLANFLRDGSMSFNNQGKRPNFWSQQDMLNLEVRPYNDDNHTIWVGGAVKYVSTPSEIDFDLPRIFVSGCCSES